MMNIVRIYRYLKNSFEKYRLKQLKFGHLGNNVIILNGFRFGYTDNMIIHDNVMIGENAFINAHGGIEIKSGTITGPDIMIFSENHIYDSEKTVPFDNDVELKKVTIDENCWIGGKVFICPGVHLGEACVVAGGSVVTKSFPSLSVLGGNPAKLLKTRDMQLYQVAKQQGDLHKNFHINNK